MKATLHGCVDRPALAVIGVWDPFLPKHEQLCAEMVRAAREQSLTSLAIVLHPNPPALIYGHCDYPMYDDVRARVWRLRACGIDAVLKLQMTRTDVDAGPSELLDTVLSAVPLAELWLGHQQSFGRGEQGARDTMRALAERRGIRVSVLARPPAEDTRAGYQALKLLVGGRLLEAIDHVGHPPIRHRPASGVLRLPWPPGRYQAVPLDHPGADPAGPGVTVTLEQAAARQSVMCWPDQRARCLAFVAGAADEAFSPALTG
jgi:hypothetical protein